MTEGESEDSDPGGTSVLRVTCIDYMFGPRKFLKEWDGQDILSIVERRAAHPENNRNGDATVAGNAGGVS